MVSGVSSSFLSSSPLFSSVKSCNSGLPRPLHMATTKKMIIRCDRAAQFLSKPTKDSKLEKIAFDESMVGVKGLADSGIKKLPPIFIHDNIVEEKKLQKPKSSYQVPIIDIGIDGASQDLELRGEIVSKLRDACEKWGFFQIVNHGIPSSLMEKAIEASIRFHEQDPEIKRKYYSRDTTKRVIFSSNFFLYNTSKATWKDSFLCQIAPVDPDWEELPEMFRGVMDEYGKELERVGLTLYELLSEALGLDKNYLRDLGCAEGIYIKGHYSPPCPEPDLTLGSVTHTDFGFLTVVLQNEVEGLQVLHENEYVDVPPTPGSLSVNLGDMFQLCTNDRFKSVHHRAMANSVGPRVNCAGFLRANHGKGYTSRSYGPIKELLTEENPALYREVTLEEYIEYYTGKGFDGYVSLPHFRAKN